MKIKELLKSEEKWTQGEAARDEDGNRVGQSSPMAHSYCLLGALFVCHPNDREKAEGVLVDAIIKKFPRRTKGCESRSFVVIDFNDHKNTTFEDVRAVVEAADV